MPATKLYIDGIRNVDRRLYPLTTSQHASCIECLDMGQLPEKMGTRNHTHRAIHGTHVTERHPGAHHLLNRLYRPVGGILVPPKITRRMRRFEWNGRIPK